MRWVHDQIALREVKDRKQILSSINKLIGIVGPLESIRADGPQLRAILNAVPASQHGEAPSYWAQIKTRCLRALRHLELDDVKGRDVDLSAAWRQLYNRVPQSARKPLRKRTVRLARWASREGLGPYELRAKHIKSFEVHLDERCRKHGRQHYLQVCDGWDNAVVTFNFWPRLRIQCKKRRLWYTRPMSEYPESLNTEIEEMLEERRSADLRVTRWRAPLRKGGEQNVRTILRNYLHHLCETGISPRSLTSLDAAITPRNAARALDHATKQHIKAHPFRIYGWAVEVRNIARNWLRRADCHKFSPITRKHYRRLQCPTTATNDLIRWLDDSDFRQRALRLSKAIVEHYRGRVSVSAKERHVLLAALAVDLSIKTTLPLNLIAQLRINEDIRPGVGPAPAALVAGSAANPEERDLNLTKVTSKLLALYLDLVHDTAADDVWLFRGLVKGHRNPIALGRSITRLAKRELQVDLHAGQHRYLVVCMRRAQTLKT